MCRALTTNALPNFMKPNAPLSGHAESDNLCKRLAELFPEEFAQWLFGVTGPVAVEKTELSREPIRADAVILSHPEVETLHIEFQTTRHSQVPLPLRMLDYYVGLKRQHPTRRVRQALLLLKASETEVATEYLDENTTHRYAVIKLWEVDPMELLSYQGLIPLATLCHTTSAEDLLTTVAHHIDRVPSAEQRRETLNASRLLAGLRYNEGLVNRLLRENDMIEESVIYQDILQKGEQRGILRGELKLLFVLLQQRFGRLTPTMRQRIGSLDMRQVEELGKAIFTFNDKRELQTWLKARVR